jgi:8-oxo-dGTP diphosphatase
LYPEGPRGGRLLVERRLFFAVKALILHEGRFLAMHRSDGKNDSLDLPGGRMEFGETAEETVIREVMEETGLIIKPIRVLDTWNSIIREDYQITGIIYLSSLEGGDVRLSAEHDRYEWLGANAIGRLYRVFRERMANWDWAGLVSTKSH